MGLKDLISQPQNDKGTPVTNPIAIFNLCNREKAYAYLRENQKEFLKNNNEIQNPAKK